MNSTHKTDWREQRRLQAVVLHQKGWPNSKIAEAFAVSRGAVSQWLARFAQGGQEALLHRSPPGLPPKLSAAQLSELPPLLLAGPTAYGFTGELWTSARVAWLIKFKFGSSFHRAHVCRILKQLGWSRQKPIERATQRDEAAIQAWRDQRWPELKKSSGGRASNRVGRPKCLLFAAFYWSHLRADWSNTHFKCEM